MTISSFTENFSSLSQDEVQEMMKNVHLTEVSPEGADSKSLSEELRRGTMPNFDIVND